MKFISFLNLIFVSILSSCAPQTKESIVGRHNLEFTELAQVWDEAMPLGNGMVGNLVWQKEGKLRFSLDRADLWDLRPMGNIDFDKWKFKDVYDYWTADKYDEVQNAFDGENAARVFRTFAECFCLKNSFHVNGDQCKEGEWNHHRG